MRLRAPIKAAGKTAAGVVVPAEFVDALGGGRRPAVRVTVGDYTFRTSIGSMGGLFMLPVTNETRARTGLAAGQTVDFDIVLDTEPRAVEVPADLASALAANADAERAFERLSYSEKRRLVIPIEAIKGADTRARRIERTVAALAAGKT